MTDIIEKFIVQRKEQWLDTKKKSAKDDEMTLLQKANEQFTLSNWIENASLRAKQLHIVTHIAKLSHPDAKATSFVASCSKSNDGYLRTGNVDYQLDVYGNAAALDVYSFLSLPFRENLSVLEAFEKCDSEMIKFINELGLDFETIRLNFLKVKKDESKPHTSRLIKQVYFPVAPGKYHLLSIVSSTGMMAELNKHIRIMRQNAKENRERIKHEDCQEAGFDDLPNLTKIGFGGSKPQNISSINNQEHGVFFLILSVPPKLSQKYQRLPSDDFFAQSINARDSRFRYEFNVLNHWLSISLKNQKVRQNIRNHLEHLVDQILFTAQSYQLLEGGWSEAKPKLPLYQKIWLDQKFESERIQDNQWRDQLANRMALWITESWENTLYEKRFGDDEIHEIKQLILSQKEFF